MDNKTPQNKSADQIILAGRLQNKSADQIILAGRLQNKIADQIILAGRLQNKIADQVILARRLQNKIADQIILSGRLHTVAYSYSTRKLSRVTTYWRDICYMIPSKRTSDHLLKGYFLYDFIKRNRWALTEGIFFIWFHQKEHVST